jgi:hypothetical protein
MLQRAVIAFLATLPFGTRATTVIIATVIIAMMTVSAITTSARDTTAREVSYMFMFPFCQMECNAVYVTLSRYHVTLGLLSMVLDKFSGPFSADLSLKCLAEVANNVPYPPRAKTHLIANFGRGVALVPELH